ncbi:MAG: VOC family protein [Tepidiformaceae bacterium]
MPAITGIAHVELSVRDLDLSSAWYCRLLDAREVFRGADEAEGIVDCAIFERASRVVIAFTQHSAGDGSTFTPRRTGLDHLAFAVADRAALEAWAAHLDELGIERSPLNDYGYADAITCKDPDGIALEFFWQHPRS